MRAFTGAAGLAPGLTYDFVFPGRSDFALQYQRLAASQGFRTDVPPALGADVVIGTALSTLLATGKPPTKRATIFAEVAIAGLRAT
jgi:hypothetical protein